MRAWISRWMAGGIQLSVGVGEDCFVVLIDDVVGCCPPVRGLRFVVLLAHFRAVPDLRDQLLLRAEVVRHQRLQRPDLVQQQQLCGGVVTVVADHGAHDRPVLLLDVGAVVAVARP